jgi:hypothetical protein
VVRIPIRIVLAASALQLRRDCLVLYTFDSFVLCISLQVIEKQAWEDTNQGQWKAKFFPQDYTTEPEQLRFNLVGGLLAAARVDIDTKTPQKMGNSGWT